MAFSECLLLVLFALVTTSTSFAFAEEEVVAPILDVSSLNRSSFPAGFIFGTASSAYQYEGGAKEGGRGASIWDVFSHKYSDKIQDRSNGDVANDEYHHYKEDVGMMKYMNLDAYRFSISWSRILPNGKLSGGINQEGIKYYNNLDCEDPAVEGWLKNGLKRVLGSGKNILFWKDRWVGELPLQVSFRRLFSITTLQGSTVDKMGFWENDNWVWNFKWRRNLFSWEEELTNDLLLLIQESVVRPNVQDGVNWVHDKSKIYSVKSASNVLSKTQTQVEDGIFKKIWSSAAPTKVKAFCWRLVLNRIPTCDNLLKRNISILDSNTLCPFCKLQLESAEHVFLSCSFSYAVWMMIYNWLNVDLVLHNNPKISYLHHLGLNKAKFSQKFWALIWFAAVWSLWLLRNDMIFKNAQADHEKLVELVKYRTWAWGNADGSGKGFSFVDWSLNPVACIQPFVTLFHWDLPQTLEDEYAGFLSPNIVKHFRDYAELCYEKFGDRVKYWITLNEPMSFSFGGYATGQFAPGRCSKWVNPNCTGGDSGTEPYLVSHHQLLAHAAAVQVYKKKYQASQKGVIGITLISPWFVPFSNHKFDKRATGRAIDFMLGWFMEPLTIGKYPKSMRSLVGRRLPKFNTVQARLLKGSFDFIGLNYYTSMFAANAPRLSNARPNCLTDSLAKLTTERNGVPIGPRAASEWLYVYPRGIQELLLYIKKKYNNPLIYITENGIDEFNDPTLSLKEALVDTFRVDYYYRHLFYLQSTISAGVNVKGYFAWSLLDNFEWVSGYTVRFGINFVDYKNGSKRYSKLSAQWFKNFLK